MFGIKPMCGRSRKFFRSAKGNIFAAAKEGTGSL
jgi:hypothetical protein